MRRRQPEFAREAAAERLFRFVTNLGHTLRAPALSGIEERLMQRSLG
jgi:hypothetical protein